MVQAAGLVCRFGSLAPVPRRGIAPELCDLAGRNCSLHRHRITLSWNGSRRFRAYRAGNQPTSHQVGSLRTNFRHSLLCGVRSLQQPIAGIYLKIRKISAFKTRKRAVVARGSTIGVGTLGRKLSRH